MTYVRLQQTLVRVHSDRIYKTVYPKAPAEFLRIGGYPGLRSPEIEKVISGALPLLGESADIVSKGGTGS